MLIYGDDTDTQDELPDGELPDEPGMPPVAVEVDASDEDESVAAKPAVQTSDDDPVVEPIADVKPAEAPAPGAAVRDELAKSTPPVRGAKEGTLQDQIVARNKERFANVQDDPAQQSQLFLAERFLKTPGTREAYLKADEKGRANIIRNIVDAEAEAEVGDYRGKDRATRIKTATVRLRELATGITDMPEFNPDPAPDAKDKKSKKDELGAGTELSVSVATGLGKGAAGIVGASATLLGLAGGDNADRNALGRFADGVRKFTDDMMSDLDKTRDKFTSASTKAAREEWDRVKKTGSNYEIAKFAASSPYMWANEGAHMLGMMAPGLGAGGLATKGVQLASKSLGVATSVGNATATAVGAAAAGAALTEPQAAQYEKEILAQPVEKHKTYVGWWDIKHTMETARGKDVPDAEVSQRMAREMRDMAWKYDFPLTTATMMVGPVGVATLGKRLGVEMAEGYTGGLTARAVKGATSEATQEVAQQYASNTAREAIRMGVEAGDGKVAGHLQVAAGSDAAREDLLDSAILGGAMGGLAGPFHKGAKKEKPEPKPEPTPYVPEPIGSDPLASVQPPRLPSGAADAGLRAPAAQAPTPDVLAQAMARVSPPAVNAPTTPHRGVPSAPSPDVLAQAIAKVEAPTANVDAITGAAGKAQQPDTLVNPEIAQALAAQHGAPTVADDGTVYAPAPRAIDAADPYHVVNSLDPETQTKIADDVAAQLADPGYKLVEAAASDTVARIVKAELPDASPEVIAEVSARVRDTAAMGGVVRAPKIGRDEAKQLSYRETRRRASEAAQRVLGNNDFVAEIEAMAPGRVGDSKKYREWAARVKEAEDIQLKRPAEFTPEHQAILAYDTVLKEGGRLGPMTPAVKSTPRASVGQKPAQHVSAARVTAIAHDYVNNAMKDLGVNAVIVETHAKIDPSFGNVRPDAKAFIHTDADGTTTVGLIADMLGTEADVRAALEHEVVGHYKLERVLGDDGVTDLANRVFAGVHRDPKSSALWERIQKDYPTGNGVMVKDQVLEFIARVAEEPADTKGGRVALQGVKDSLLRAGYRATDSMSMSDLKTLINDIRAVKDPDYNPIASKDYATEGQRLEVNPKEVVIRESKLRKIERYLFDRAIDMTTMLRDLGMQNGLAHRLFLAMSSNKDRIVNGEIIENHVVPLVKAIDAIAAKHGRTRDETMHLMNNWAQARHRDERALWMRNIEAKLKSADLETRRDQIIQAGLKGEAAGGMSPRQARRLLDELVTDETVANASDKIDNVKHSGLDKAEATKMLTEIADRGLLADFDALNEPGGALTKLRDVTKKYALSSGHYHNAMTEMAGYELYVPEKGAKREERATRQYTDGISSVNDTQRAAKGRATMAEHGITQLMLEAQLMGARHVNQQFMRNLANAVEKHKSGKTWGSLGDAKGIEYSGGKFVYPERPNKFMLTDFAITDPETGTTRVLTLHDQGVAKVLASSYKADDPMNGALRFANASTRTLGRLYTSLSPSFLTTNAVRDVMGALEAIAFEKAQAAGTEPAKVRVHKDQLKAVAKAMMESYTRGDTRRLFMATQGEREAIILKWRSPEEAARIRKEFDGDPEGLKRALSVREHAIEFVEGGGVIGFGRFIDPTQTFKTADALMNASPERPTNVLEAPGYAVRQAGRGLDAVTGYMESLGTFVDNGHRLGVYMGLRSQGVPKDLALVKARTTSLDFNQRSGMRDMTSGQMFSGAFMFVQPSLTGVHSMVTRRLWRAGEMPLEVVTGPDGLKFERLKPGWQKELNRPLATYLIATGFATTMLAAQTMGTGEDGEDNARRIALGSWFRNHMLGTGERPFMIPQQYGVHQMFSGIGTMLALRSLGYGEMGELAKEMANVTLNNTVPGLRFQVPDGQQTTLQMLAQGITPSLLQPAIQHAMNRNAFGQPIVNEPNPQKQQFASDMDRASTPAAYAKLAREIHEAGGPDLQPEIYMHWVGQLGYVGSTVNEMAKWASSTNTDKGLLDVAKVGLRRDFSGDSYESRQHTKFMEETFNPLAKQLSRAKKLDSEESDAIKGRPGRKNPVGPREAAFRAANPQMVELEAATRGFEQASSVIKTAAMQAKSKGQDDRSAAIAQIRRDAINKFHEMRKEGRLKDAPRALDRFVRERIAAL